MTDLESCFDGFRRSAFRLETLPLYDAADDVRFAAYRRHEPLPERSNRSGEKNPASKALTGSPRSIWATPSPIEGASLNPCPENPLTTSSPGTPTAPISACASGESVYMPTIDPTRRR